MRYLFAQGSPGPGGLPGEQGKVGPPVSDSSDRSRGFSLTFLNNVNKQQHMFPFFLYLFLLISRVNTNQTCS